VYRRGIFSLPKPGVLLPYVGSGLCFSVLTSTVVQLLGVPAHATVTITQSANPTVHLTARTPDIFSVQVRSTVAVCWIRSLFRRANICSGSAYGSTCVRDISNNPRCQGSNYSPQPTITYEAGTSTYTYESWTASTSTYSYATATPESTSAYISFPYSNSTTTTSKKSSSRESNTIFGAETTSSAQSGNGPPLLSSAQSTVPGYFVTGVMFFMVVAGLV